MTMICEAKSKAVLQEKLNAGCNVQDPTPFGNRIFRSQDAAIGFREPVCLDPATRRRFATIEKTVNGWKVK